MKVTNPDYRGDCFYAIVCFNKDYSTRFEITKKRLEHRLEEEKSMLKGDYTVLETYEEVNEKGGKIIGQAARDLKSGKKIDLKTLLE